MPQPFRRAASANSQVVMHTARDPIFPKCPGVSILALSAIASWSHVDAELLRVFVQIMGGRGSMGASMYVALGSQAAKAAAIEAVGRNALDKRPAELELLQAVLKIAKQNQKFRDKLAHWLWCYCGDLPDALVLMDPRCYGSDPRESALVFDSKELSAYIDANERLLTYAWQLEFVIKVPDQTPKRQSIFKRLSEAAEVIAARPSMALPSDDE